ncbi:peptidylprolyl isomerase [uncultured Sphaerochaeta sp.]|uniref:peptidylprolyl isomerase n=1 Tax=uncultured Sphaerochaeta sp. TaxID=886478 RepID=UPI002A0A48D6|nr:peptidylprolyl isomerase [uncultured Sphaerochaeta sp.]
MKRFFLVLISILCLVSPMLFSAAINAPAAMVKLIKTTPISTAELDTEVRKYQDSATKNGQDPTTVDPLQVLNLLINNELFKQGAERDGVKITDVMIDQAYASQKANIEKSYSQSLTDDQFTQLINTNYGSVEAYKKMLAEQLMVDSYVRMKKSADIDKPITITAEEIQSFYRKNKTQFVSPETVKLSHIYIPFSTDKDTDAKNKTLLENIDKQIKAGTLSFEKAVAEYSQDAQSKTKAGDIGWLTMDNKDALAGLGQNFFDVAFSTEVGSVSSVVTSLTGYHILKVLAYNDSKILALTDPINPNTTSTISDYIKSQLSSSKQQEVYYAAINSLVSDLRKNATVTILYKK